MRRIVRYSTMLLIVSVLANCGEGIGSASEKADPTVRTNPPPELIEEFTGMWMPQAYCECLGKRRSAYACRDLVNDIFVMHVAQVGDSLRWSYLTTHEGGPEIMLGYKPGGLSFEHRDADARTAAITLTSLDPDHVMLTSTQNHWRSQRFQRVETPDTELRNILTDEYYKDSTNSVVFAGDGNIQGLEGLTRYHVLTDFTEGFDTLDIVFLHNGSYDWSKDAYHYRFDGLDLLLYPMVPTSEPYVYQIGELKYRLMGLKH